MNISKINILFFLLLVFFLTSIIFSLNLKWDLVGLSFFIIMLFTNIYMIFSLKSEISSALFVYTFFITFFVVFPWVQYTNEVIIWSNNRFVGYDYFLTNTMLFIALFIFFIAYKIFNVNSIKFNNSVWMNSTPNLKLGISINLLCVFTIFYYNNFDLNHILFRGGVDGEDIIEKINNPLMTIFVYFSRFFPVFLFLRYVSSNIKDKSLFLKIVLLSFVLICAFPLGVPRFMVAFIYFPIFYYYLKYFRKTYLTFSVLILSLIVIFPFLDQFRVFDASRDIKFLPNTEYFFQAHFDAYQNLMEAVRTHYITYGWQLLGVILFFIPRTIWNDKPVGSGFQMANDLNYHFNNISMPFLAEGFVNFGFLGFCLFSCILGVFCKIVDYKMLTQINSKDNSYEFFIGIFYCASIFFMMRGDLMSSFSYTIAGISAYKMAKKI